MLQAQVGQANLSALFRFGEQPRTFDEGLMIGGIRGQVLFAVVTG
jgi:hypothetical protein